MAKNKKHKANGSNEQELYSALTAILVKHPTRAFNHKQVSKLLLQNYPELASQYLFLDDKEKNRQLILKALDQLTSSGDVEEVDTGRYRIVPVEEFVVGEIQMTSTGAGYVMNENHEQDILISQYNTASALDGDTVRVLLFARKSGRRQEGEVVEVIKRSRSLFAGTLKVQHKYSYVIPDSTRVNLHIQVPFGKMKEARPGDKVVVNITQWPDDVNEAEGEIVEILGRPGDNNAEMHAILVEYGFPTHFPKSVENQAELIPYEIPEKEIAKRRDLRTTTTFTIDPVDAKDFDDALSINKINDDVYEVGVHIADVSYYLKPETEMDEEAFSRATSVYLVDRVVPMLPEKLSNHVCSLRPNEDKLCYSVVFKIDESGYVHDTWYGRTVIHSDRRFTYEEAQEVIEGADAELSDEILLLDRIAKKLRAERFKKGAISFEREEVKFKLDENGIPLGVYTKENKDSNKLIEEFMLLANRSVAEFIGKKHAGKTRSDMPQKPPVFVYRIHDSPVPDKLKTFSGFAGRFGYKVSVSGDKDIARSLNKLLKDVRGKAEQNVLEQLAIRTMAKAVYTTENIGHYGLAFEYYTHFTSPIRRYPDVLVHRLLDHYMHGGKSVSQKEYEQMCQHSTNMEIKASEAERASIKYKQVEYLQSKKGEVFDGIISGVTEWGFYVELAGNKCEGMVRMRDLVNDYYNFDEKSYAIVGHRTGTTYRLGDEVKVVLKQTNLEKRQIDFILYTTGSIESVSSRDKHDSWKGRKKSDKKSSGGKSKRKKR